jgi:LysM repeat protein
VTTPAPPAQQGGGNFLTTKYGGLPGYVWLIGAGVGAYFLFFKNKSSSAAGGASSTGGGGQSTTGDISLQPGTETIQLQAPSSQLTAQTATASPGGSVGQGGSAGSSGGGNSVGQGGQTGTPNPQPTPKPPPRHKTGTVTIHHKAVKPQFVTVAQWPGKSVNGLAQWNTTLWGIANHTGTTVEDLLKLNPGITNPNLVYPGEKIKIK